MTWKHEVGKRHPVVLELDLALGKAMSEGWDGIMVALRWPRYEVVLRQQLLSRGLTIDPGLQTTLDDHPERAPLRSYRAFSLCYIPKNKLTDYIAGTVAGDTQTLHLEPLPGDPPEWRRP